MKKQKIIFINNFQKFSTLNKQKIKIKLKCIKCRKEFISNNLGRKICDECRYEKDRQNTKIKD